MVFGFDISYFEKFAVDGDPTQCPNELYVAATRGLERLTVLHQSGKSCLPFLDQCELRKTCKVRGTLPKDKPLRRTRFPTPKSVTDLLKHHPFHVIGACVDMLTLTRTEAHEKIDIPMKIKTSTSTFEAVSEITGIALPVMYEIQNKRKSTMHAQISQHKRPKMECIDKRQNMECVTKKVDKLLKDDVNDIAIPDLLFLANYWNAIKDGVLFKVCQIHEYAWVSPEMMELGVDRIKSLHMGDHVMFEQHMAVNVSHPQLRLVYPIHGYIDCVDVSENTVYEFKCVQQITNEHILQLAVYMYMWEREKRTNSRYILYNICTDEQIELKSTFENVEDLVVTLIRSKMTSDRKISNTTFLKETKALREPIFMGGIEPSTFGS